MVLACKCVQVYSRQARPSSKSRSSKENNLFLSVVLPKVFFFLNREKNVSSYAGEIDVTQHKL